MASSGNIGNNNVSIRLSIDGTDIKTNGNRTLTATSGSWGTPLNMAARTGKWYIEYYVNSGSSGRNVMVVPTNSAKYQQANYNFPATGDYGIILNSGGSIYNNNDSTATQTGLTSLATGDIMAVAMNLDASPKTVQFYRNGTTIGTAENINASATGHFTFMMMGHNATTMTVNAGQDSSFAGAKSTGTANAADDNGFGNFYYTPPSGFLAMCGGNLPISSDIDPATTDSDNPTKQFGAEKFTGNGGTQTIVLGDGFQPDLVVLKNTGTANGYIWLDSSRGYNKTLNSNNNSAEGTDSYTGYGIESNFFGSTGIVANDGGSPGFNASTNNYIVYGWRANGGTTSTNTSGTITTTVQANQSAGFSILTYTGTGSNATIGHGLSQKPDFILFKRRSGTGENWNVYHSHVGATKYLLLNSYAAMSTSSTRFQDTEPTSTVITLGNESAVNTSTGTHVAYVWHDVEGFSKYGGYEGSNNDDGPFIYTGFRPRMVWIKNCDTDAEWCSFDTARGIQGNPISRVMQLDENYEERGRAVGTNVSAELDFLANGFKCRENGSRINTSHTFIYMAWADVPFKYGNTHNQYSS